VSDFGFLTNHAQVLVCVGRDPETRLRDIAECVGITERAAHRIVCELEGAGYLKRRRVGRRNAYEIDPELSLRRELERGIAVGDLLELTRDKDRAAAAEAA
jgi:DNA-binding IclR family transcriptional regulator